MTIHPYVRACVAAAALVCSLTSITLTRGRATAAQQTSRPDDAAAGEGLRAPATRFAFIDTQGLAEKGVMLDAAAEADLKAFGEGLNIKIFDVARLQGVLFIADSSLDVTDGFIRAVKAKSSRAGQIQVPAVNVPDARVAFVNTDSFSDPAAGVTRLTKAFAEVEREFSPRREEISRLREQSGAASGEKKERLESRIEEKEAAGRAALEKRVKELTGPVYEDIGKALSRFCKRHGISLIFDASKFDATDKLPPFDLTLPPGTPDVSAAFISEYNRGLLKP